MEKYLKKYNDENKDSTREGNGAQDAACIVMDVHSGEVLAMASYPTFDLNDTRNPEALIGSKLIDVSGNSTDTVINEEIAASMKQEENNDLLVQNLNALWKNYCINSTYEPGSTMKPFVAAMGLEDGRLKGNESFECTGIIEIGGYKIRCHNYTNGAEGWLTIGESIERSCNVTLIRIAQVIGIDEFLKYMSEYNFGLKTNIDLAGEARTASLVFNSSTMGPTELATSSFGQGFNVTMIQMITGFCSLINGGYYYEPHMVSKITAADGSVVKNIEPRLLKQTISAETSEKIREYCVQVVEGANGTGKRAKPAGYRIGGKSGTAEIRVTRDIEDDYVASYCCFAPADDPELIMLIQADYPNPEIGYYGSKVVTSYAQEIMEEILPYMGFYPEYTDEEAKEMNVSVPLLQDATLDTAKSTLEQLGLTYEVVGSGSSVISQSPTTGTSIVKGGKVLLYTEQNATPDLVSVPNLVGMTASQANETMAYYGLNYALVGAPASSEGALVKSQSVPEGTQIQRGSSVTLTLSAGEATD